VNIAKPNASDRWDSRTTFVLALSASSLGLGNLWRLSYLSGENGGGAFVITYVLCLFFFAVPVMVAEVVLGSYGGPDTMAAMSRASDSSMLSRGWRLVGALACLTGLLILSLYVVVAGWSLAYAGFMQEGVFSTARAVEVGAYFEFFLTQSTLQIYWQSLFLLVVVGTVVLGVQRGLAMLVWFAVPLMLAMLAFLVKFGFDNGDLDATRDYLFSTTMVDFTPRSALVALGHALFTLGVGVGTGITYGAYAPHRVPIGRSVMAVAVFDTVIAILAGLAIYSIVFANNMEPTAGPGLLFISLPYAFGNLMEGELAGTVFFALLGLAALGSAVAILEPIVATLKRELRLERLTTTLLVGTVVWLVSLAIVASLGPASEFKWFGTHNLLTLIDTVTSTLLLPLVSLLIVLFVGWCMRPEILRLVLTRESDLFFSLWRVLLRYIAPPAIILLMLAPSYWP
jgi:NSS family neurotransmitter:Na+ symporter